MPSVAPAVTHSIILLVLLRYRKQQKANTALDQGQHLPKEAKGKVQWVHTLERTEKSKRTNKTHVYKKPKAKTK